MGRGTQAGAKKGASISTVVGRLCSKLPLLAVVAALSFMTAYLLLPQFDPPAWQQPFLREDRYASPAACAPTRKASEADGHYPPFVKIEELLATAGNVSRQRRAPGCPPEGTGRLCRLEDVFDEIFLISLPRATERLARVRAQLAALGVTYTLVHAMEGKLMAGAQHLAKIVMTNPSDQHPGVFALFLTHLGILDYVTKSPGLERVLILEDDVTFCADFPRAFDARIRRIPDDWRMLWLGGLVWQATYQNTEALDHFVDVGFARPTRMSTAFALGLRPESVAFVAQQMMALGEAIDEQAFAKGLIKWPNQTVLMWPPVAMTNPYHGSGLGHGWMETPAVWARDNGFDLTNFDLARGYHIGGELGSDLRCAIDEPGGVSGAVEVKEEEDVPTVPVVENAAVVFFVGQTEVVDSSAECCARCSRDFPWCLAWRWYPNSRRCVISSDTTPRVWAARTVSGRMVQEDSVPRVPNVVHFFQPRPDDATPARPRLDVWSYISVLSAAINTEPDHIRWWHHQGHGGGSLPEGHWWDECVRPLISSINVIADSATGISAEQREDDARLAVLIKEGGIMLDTDALVVRSFAPLRARQEVSLARDGLDRKLAAVGVVVAQRDASFLHRWRALARDQSLSHDYRSQAVALQLAEQHPDEVKLLSHAAFNPRSNSPHHLKVAYEADDCSPEAESFSVHRHSSAARARAPATREGGEEESAADEVERVFLGEGSLHRVARAILRKALASGRLCALAEREVRRLETEGGVPTCAPPPAPPTQS
jgi:GR25 family glycosyltransferase involved in LPS biosynthesis